MYSNFIYVALSNCHQVDPVKQAELDQRHQDAQQEIDLAEDEIKQLKAAREELESDAKALVSREVSQSYSSNKLGRNINKRHH